MINLLDRNNLLLKENGPTIRLKNVIITRDKVRERQYEPNPQYQHNPIALRYVHPEIYGKQNALVPITPYFDEENYAYDPHLMIREPYHRASIATSSPNPQMNMENLHPNEGFTLSQETLMFIANHGEARQNVYPQRLLPSQFQISSALQWRQNTGPCTLRIRALSCHL